MDHMNFDADFSPSLPLLEPILGVFVTVSLPEPATLPSDISLLMAHLHDEVCDLCYLMVPRYSSDGSLLNEKSLL